MATPNPRRAIARALGYFRIDAPSNDRGALSPAVAILAVMIFTLAGLVIDGGRQLGAKSRAVGYAQEAARAGVGTIDFNSAEAKIDITKGGDAVSQFCAQVTANDSAVTSCGTSEIDDEHVKVIVQIANKTSFLGMVGIQTLTANGEGEAHAEQGIKKADETPQIPPIVVQTSGDGPGVTVQPTANPPTLDLPCPIWTIGSPTPTWDPPIPVPFPASCTPSVTPNPTETGPSGSPNSSPSPTPPTSSGGG
jgi:hypothetical protein